MSLFARARLILAGLFALSGLITLALDIWRSLDQGGLAVKSLGAAWYELDRGSLNLAQSLVQRYLLPELWNPVIATTLSWPAFLWAFAVAALLLLSVRIKRR